MPAEPDEQKQSVVQELSPIPPQDIRAEMEKILCSPEFRGSAMLRNVLRFVVEKTLAGNAGEIKGYTIATQVLERKGDFDGNKDPIVRILAGRLRQALEHYYLTEGTHDPIIIDIPKGTYVPFFRHGSRETANFVEPTMTLPTGPTVAVLPLLNLSGDPHQEYFADGLAEELTSELARYQDLRVIAFQSTRCFKGKELDVREVGRDLKVRFVVGGSVRKASRTIKIDLQLIDALNGSRLWGEQFCRELEADSIIALQEEIARKVVGKIGSLYGVIFRTLSREARKKPPEILETYEALLHFHHHITVLSPQTFAESREQLEQAVRREPESGLAWSFLAFLYGQSYSLQLAPMESPLEQALVAAQKGAALEPENQITRIALAHVHFFRNNRELFLSEAEAAIALNPNAPAPIGFLGWLLALYGEWERGLAILEKGKALNPNYPGWFHMAPCFYYFLQKSSHKAHQEAQQLHMPHLFWDPLLRAAALGHLGKKAEAAQALAELLTLKPDFPQQAPFLIGCYAKFEYLRTAIQEGLHLAGL